MEKEEILNNFTFFGRCLQILKFNEFTKSQLREKTKDTLNNANLNIVLEFLEENGFISIDKSRIPYIYSVKQEKLARLLRESCFFKDFGKIIEITKSIYIY